MNPKGCCLVGLMFLTSSTAMVRVHADGTRPAPAVSVKVRNEAVLASLSCKTAPKRLTAHAARIDVVRIFELIGPIAAMRFRVVRPPNPVQVLGFHVIDQPLCDLLTMLADKLDLSYTRSPKDGVIKVTVGTDKKEVDLGAALKSS